MRVFVCVWAKVCQTHKPHTHTNAHIQAQTKRITLWKGEEDKEYFSQISALSLSLILSLCVSVSLCVSLSIVLCMSLSLCLCLCMIACACIWIYFWMYLCLSQLWGGLYKSIAWIDGMWVILSLSVCMYVNVCIFPSRSVCLCVCDFNFSDRYCSIFDKLINLNDEIVGIILFLIFQFKFLSRMSI